jgi:BirA family biotin operon repressor/biotin-[acetyl-CoA-carboxylase] ligase
MKDWEIIQLESCLSSNEYAKKLMSSNKTTDKTAIVTDFQEKGRGQKKNRWHSEKGKNLLCSFIYMTKIEAEKHFLLNIAISITIVDALKSLGIQAKIKWPNDIYINKHKVAGILIENRLFQNIISSSIIGIGLNVNQKKFPAWIPNPVSLSMISNKNMEIEGITSLLIENFEQQMKNIKKQPASIVFNRYLDNMYQYKTWAVYQTNQHQFTGRILGVQPSGHLIIETGGGQILSFDFGEIKYC